MPWEKQSSVRGLWTVGLGLKKSHSEEVSFEQTPEGSKGARLAATWWGRVLQVEGTATAKALRWGHLTRSPAWLEWSKQGGERWQ